MTFLAGKFFMSGKFSKFLSGKFREFLNDVSLLDRLWTPACHTVYPPPQHQ